MESRQIIANKCALHHENSWNQRQTMFEGRGKKDHHYVYLILVGKYY